MKVNIELEMSSAAFRKENPKHTAELSRVLQIAVEKILRQVARAEGCSLYGTDEEDNKLMDASGNVVGSVILNLFSDYKLRRFDIIERGPISIESEEDEHIWSKL